MDPNTDKMLAQYATTNDSSLQQQALNGLQQIMVEQLPSIPLVEPRPITTNSVSSCNAAEEIAEGMLLSSVTKTSALVPALFCIASSFSRALCAR